METSGVLWQQTHGHPPEEVLERYSMASAVETLQSALDEEERDRVEEHLLLCESCRKQLDACDQWVALMKAAAVPEMQGHLSPPVWQRWWQALSGGLGPWPALAGGLAMLIAAIWISPAFLAGDPTGVAQPVSLSALRGNDLRAEVHAGTALNLTFEDYDIAGSSVAVVNPNGALVWSGILKGNAVLVPSLKKGTYWVRLNAAGSGETIKEYGLRVD
jgi:hypothetical protein